MVKQSQNMEGVDSELSDLHNPHDKFFKETFLRS